MNRIAGCFVMFTLITIHCFTIHCAPLRKSDLREKSNRASSAEHHDREFRRFDLLDEFRKWVRQMAEKPEFTEKRRDKTRGLRNNAQTPVLLGDTTTTQAVLVLRTGKTTTADKEQRALPTDIALTTRRNINHPSASAKSALKDTTPKHPLGTKTVNLNVTNASVKKQTTLKFYATSTSSTTSTNDEGTIYISA